MSGGNDRWEHFKYEAREMIEDFGEVLKEVFVIVWEIIKETLSVIWEVIVELFTGIFTDFWEIAIAIAIILFLWYSFGGFKQAEKTIQQEAPQTQQGQAVGQPGSASQNQQPIIHNPDNSQPQAVQPATQKASPTNNPRPVAPGSDIYITQ